MSIEASCLVWKISQSKGADRLVLLCLANYTNNNGIAWPSIETIHRDTLVSERQVTRSIASLEAIGELEIIEKGDGRGRSTVYRIALKGDAMSPFSPNGKGDILSLKGDISSIKGDILSVKDDTLSPQSLEPLYNHKEPEEEAPDPVREIEKHFTNVTGLMPSRSSWSADWETPIKLWLNGTSNIQAIKDKITQAWEISRKKGLTIVSPRSLNNTIVNLNGNGKTPDNTTWQRIVTAVTNGVFTGLSSEEKTALRAIGGLPVIKAMTPYDEPKLKSQFFQALGTAT